ncbi:ADP-ribosylation factor, putative [Theileria equi strain WA]|uniref:ADP-ribosylation factor, putative n=1 Tax=Theileria equi strain WA TaxID=1537102 RepID=L1LG50_THEEQ|nr:ADP-ribosylation factor, putative [Theileria equi strain WA]EKX74417.1 ADP-ribosylation factor, putative [Theileria equi strain WA]|eukprot:XP_004833869.1 ADP-ribosylation factor, putative [Theileria equi strain WA]
MKGVLTKFSKSQPIHVLLLGLRGSGKTLLLYKTFLPKWDTAAAEIEPTILYHYEEVKYSNKTLGIWDFSGDPMIRNVPNFMSRQINTSAIVFVVNILDMNDASNREIFEWISLLESEESLLESCFVILLNGTRDIAQGKAFQNFMIQVEQLKSRMGARFLCKGINATLALKDPGWVTALDFIISHSSKSNTKN